ncbi:MAG: DUF305 domain-containing protein [Patescibacteria group bacterium]
MKKEIKYGLIGLLTGGGLVWLGMMQMMGIGYGNQATMARSDTIDAHFIEQMIPHHEDAITMAKLALQKAQREEVKQLAQNIIDSQSNEITQMKQWYNDWFGKDVPQGQEVMSGHGMMGAPAMHMGMMGDETDFHRLEEAEDFDKVFVEEMIPHHQMAVMMANMLKSGTERPEMSKLADDIIAAQTTEINQMRDWLLSW